MEDRYELRGKIGQGGIGRVHRAYDHKLNREVALKRILTNPEDPSLQQEATKQLMVEAGALASLQHPHIVTILDAGVDDQGPFVVMELINGKTLDEIIENGPMIWKDFKEVAMQSMEALIAAQELDMIHSDLKPPNIMLTWLPSGTFQVKIVDFGLAALVQNQSQEEIEKMDEVFGSIFFMPPEQFERKTLDARSDLYSLGCCFYQALTGEYPFNGESGNEVMEAHLNHSVKPIQEVRGDIPLWANQWVMWLINRNRDDRPESAREALANFIHNDKKDNSAANLGDGRAKRPRLVIPTTSPQATLSPLSPETTNVPTAGAPTAQQADVVVPDATLTGAVPQRAGSKWKLSGTQLKIAAAAALLALITISAVLVKKRNDRIRREYVYTNIVTQAEDDDVEKIEISGEDLAIVLDFIGLTKPDVNIASAYRALTLATATDSTDLDAVIADFATTADIPGATRKKLFDEVIKIRESSAAVPILIDFIVTAEDPKEATSAINAIFHSAKESHASGLLKIINSSPHQEVRETAEFMMEGIIDDSKKRNDLRIVITTNRQLAETPASQQALDRLLELCNPTALVSKPPQQTPTNPPPQTPTNPPQQKPSDPTNPPAAPREELKPLIDALKGNDAAKITQALEALSNASDESAHSSLLKFIKDCDNADLRLKAVKASTQSNSQPEVVEDEARARQRWLQLLWSTQTHDERKLIIQALSSFKQEWSMKFLEEMALRSDPQSKEMALKTLEDMRKR